MTITSIGETNGAASAAAVLPISQQRREAQRHGLCVGLDAHRWISNFVGAFLLLKVLNIIEDPRTFSLCALYLPAFTGLEIKAKVKTFISSLKSYKTCLH